MRCLIVCQYNFHYIRHVGKLYTVDIRLSLINTVDIAIGLYGVGYITYEAWVVTVHQCTELVLLCTEVVMVVYRNSMYRNGTPCYVPNLSCTEVVQVSNLSKIMYRSGMYRSGHIPNWP